MKKQTIIGIFAIVFFFATIFIFTPSVEQGECDAFNDFKMLTIDGIVSKKYIDSTQHSYPIIVIQNSHEKKLDTLNLVFEKTGAFQVISLYDTIQKKANDDVLIIISGTTHTSKRIDFGCVKK